MLLYQRSISLALKILSQKMEGCQFKSQEFLGEESFKKTKKKKKKRERLQITCTVWTTGSVIHALYLIEKKTLPLDSSLNRHGTETFGPAWTTYIELKPLVQLEQHTQNKNLWSSLNMHRTETLFNGHYSETLMTTKTHTIMRR